MPFANPEEFIRNYASHIPNEEVRAWVWDCASDAAGLSAEWPIAYGTLVEAVAQVQLSKEQLRLSIIETDRLTSMESTDSVLVYEVIVDFAIQEIFVDGVQLRSDDEVLLASIKQFAARS
ncbi:hypothetical protein [Pandoraea sp. ISTKB]|uniref:hypothetical protein n=1 Tax=Pandoraea sp. ISTKB TaxID=1586708 RepID=UPI00086CCFB1|nr:hypothetical protein [Pandoraea sp. ISTKB]ODP35066.1 hypothetical protein A9762_11940 [Pandoraea sp. ISTKB]